MPSNDQSLDDWLHQKSRDAPREFPVVGNIPTNYHNRLTQVRELLGNFIHPEVNRGALWNDSGYLTDHGPGHIQTVARRASELAFGLLPQNKWLTGYESYLLLMAIELHDTGNILGRQRHEKRLQKVVQFLGTTLGTENREKRGISIIAGAHGGYVIVGGEKNKDTIDGIDPGLLLLSETVRAQLLAAILRLADELADDHSRASRFGPDGGKIPKASEVFHKYALSLHSVNINVANRCIDLQFEMSADDAVRTWGKGDGEVFLLDEIYERTLKTYLECVYCMRYIRKSVPEARIIEDVRVEIEILDPTDESDEDDNLDDEREVGERLKIVKYVMRESGYPVMDQEAMFKICAELRSNAGSNSYLDGAALKEEIESLRSLRYHE